MCYKVRSVVLVLKHEVTRVHVVSNEAVAYKTKWLISFILTECSSCSFSRKPKHVKRNYMSLKTTYITSELSTLG